MENENLSNEKSLKIITEMIETAKGNYNDNGFFLRLWGWLVLIASLGHYFLFKLTNYAHPYYVWFILVIGMIISLIYGHKLSKKIRVKTHLDKINSMLWMGFLISYFILLFAMKTFQYNIVPFILLLVGNGMFLSGIIIKFRPITWGGIFIWICATLAFYLTGDTQLLISAASMLGYLVPGYILKSKCKKNV